MGLVLDSTVLVGAERAGRSVVELLKALRKRFSNEEITLSVLSAAELVHGVWRANTPSLRAQREEFVEEVFARLPVRPVQLRTARIAGQIDAQTRAKGKVIPTVDLFIGATALELGFAVVTANMRHFRMVPGLKTVRFV